MSKHPQNTLHFPSSRIEISRLNLEHNWYEIKKFLNNKIKVGLVLKANAYGHGLRQVLQACHQLADFLCVFDFAELKQVRYSYDGPCLVLGPVDPVELLEAINLKPILSAISIPYLLQIDEILRAVNQTIKIHLSIDANFGREGVLPSELPILLETLRKLTHIEITGVFAHFSSADKPDSMVSFKQAKLFDDVVQTLKARGYRRLETHISATSGMLNQTNLTFQTNAVRIGLALYGLYPDGLTSDNTNSIKLLPVLSWYSYVAQIKELPTGTPVGYGQSAITTYPTTIALIPQGYSQGYPRSASNIGWVTIKGTRCKIVGKISMNIMMVDVTHVKDLSLGEEVVLIGPESENCPTINALAKIDQTINYEIATRLSPMIERFLI